jgi:serine/threonine protein kinase
MKSPLGRDFSIDATALQDLFGRLDEEIFAIVENRHGLLFQNSSQFRFFVEAKIIVTRKPFADNFVKIRILGRGGFGRVYACRNVMTGKLYALKMIDKKRLKYKKAEAMCLIERETMEKIRSPYNMSLKYAFSDDTSLYLVLDLMMGGDLSYHLQNSSLFTMDQARYYAARVVCSLSVLHQNHYIYRDLKPENVLLDQ